MNDNSELLKAREKCDKAEELVFGIVGEAKEVFELIRFTAEYHGDMTIGELLENMQGDLK